MHYRYGILVDLKKENYEVRLRELRLTTLEIRRKRGDFIEFCKILNGLDSVGKIRDNLFLNRTVPLWNDLPVKVKEAKSLNGFKAGLDGLGLFSTGV